MTRSRDRRLLIGQEVYRWRVIHRHVTGIDPRTGLGTAPCSEVLSLGREGSSGRVHIVFQGGPGLIVPDGYMHSGGVARSGVDGYLNLHKPGHVRAVLDTALAEGAAFDRPVELDGWRLFDAALARLAP
ncbi:hypothetical protein [Spirillospora sp. NPDC047279]|uniref:hypothetical protein n=1 Tax=Spirillospora sp. NPDC047279 TaxID=3155478 RepID=UPI0033D52107